jgi:HEAT repeat protein
MTTRFFAAVTLACVVVLGDAGHAQETAKTERSIKTWIKDFHGKDKSKSLNAVLYFLRLGPSDEWAIEPLKAEIFNKDHIVQRNVVAAIGRIGPAAKSAGPLLMRLVYNDNTDTYLNAATAESLFRIGAWNQKTASEYLRFGLAQAEAFEAQINAAQALWRIEEFSIAIDLWFDAISRNVAKEEDVDPKLNIVDSRGVAALTRHLKNQHAIVQFLALKHLGRLGVSSKPAQATILQLFSDSTGFVRAQAADVITRIHADRKIVAPAVRKLLEDDDSEVANNAAVSLSRLKDPAGIPRLLDVVKNSDDLVLVAHALACLGHYEAGLLEHADAILLQLGHKDKQVREAAQSTLVRIGPGVLPKLAELMEKKSFRSSVIKVLEVLAEDSESAAKILLKHLDSMEPIDFAKTIIATKDWKPSPDRAIPDKDHDRFVARLFNQLDAKVAGPRQMSALALASIQLDEKSVLALIEALDHEDSTVVEFIGLALRNLGPKAKQSAPKLESMLRKSTEYHSSLILALGKIGEESSIPVLLELLKSTEWPVKANVTLALGYLGPKGKKAVPDLKRLARDRDQDVLGRINAAVAVHAISGDAKFSLAVLSEMIDGVHGQHGIAPTVAINALSRIGPDAAAAIPLLKKLATDQFFIHRTAAATALWELQNKPALVLPILQSELLNAQNETYETVNIAKTLGDMGTAARDAEPELTLAAEHTDEFVRSIASRSLRLVRRSD